MPSPEPRGGHEAAGIFDALGGAALAWPHAARAQRSRGWRVGVLVVDGSDAQSFQGGAARGLGRAGNVEGETPKRISSGGERPGAASSARSRTGHAQSRRHSRALYALRPCGAKVGREIPIVVLAGDPVRLGLVRVWLGPRQTLPASASYWGGDARQVRRTIPRALPATRRIGALANAPDPIIETDA